ncbi:MAG: ABC transporter permease [Bacteroidota bacterium]
MIFNYFKLAWRNFIKDRLYAVINIVGFTIGMTVCLLIAMYVSDELSYDKFHKKADRIYRLEVYDSDFNEIELTVPQLLGPELKKEFPEVEATTTLNVYDTDLQIGEERLKAKIAGVNQDALSIFSFPLIHGDIETALDEPHEIIVSESFAKKHFNVSNPIGLETIKNSGNRSEIMKIGGVMKDIPEQSHFHADILYYTAVKDDKLTFAAYNGFNQYVLLAPNAKPETIIEKFNAKAEEYDYDAEGSDFQLRPLTNIHLYANSPDEIEANGSIVYVTTFTISALLILVLACINFINLLTARSLRRAKEIGIRKTMGAARSQLANQFFSESFFYVLIAFGFALLFTQVLLPGFNNLLNKSLQLNILYTNVGFLFIGIVLLTGFLSGLYPAWYLSSFRPSFALKNAVKGSFLERQFRNGFVVFQFVISVALIGCTTIIYQQLSYIGSKRLGYETENLMLLSGVSFKNVSLDAYRNSIQQIPGVKSVSLANWTPGEMIGNKSSFQDSTMKKPTINNI